MDQELLARREGKGPLRDEIERQRSELQRVGARHGLAREAQTKELSHSQQCSPEQYLAEPPEAHWRNVREAGALTIGVLALQGDFAEHIASVKRCGANAIEIRHSWQLDNIDGLIIPGGESTAIAKLSVENDDPIFNTIRSLAKEGMPIYGTCMGSIFLAKEIENSAQGRLALMDIKIRRNAFGPQNNSFQTSILIPKLGVDRFPAVFIRAPVVLSCGPDVRILAKIDEGIVMARQDNLLVTAFHPEITNDLRVHKYFLDMVACWQNLRLASSNA